MEFGSIDPRYATHLATVPVEDDGPVWMVNFMRYRQVAAYRDASGPAITGREADDRYAPTDVLAAIGADVAYFGDVVPGPGGAAPADRWDRMAIVRYPTRRSFIDMQERPDFKERRVHKDAGMDFTIIMGCLPLATAPEGDGDRAVRVRFRAYPAGAGRVGDVPDGLPFSVEGTIVGDERRWERLEMAWLDEAAAGPAQPDADGVMEVWSVPLIDRVRPLAAQALES